MDQYQQQVFFLCAVSATRVAVHRRGPLLKNARQIRLLCGLCFALRAKQINSLMAYVKIAIARGMQTLRG